MTELTLDRVEANTAKAERLGIIFKACIMLIGFLVCVNMLTYAVHRKLAQSEVVEDNNITAAVRERQIGCLAKNIYHEAGAESFEGKVAVAQVTLNRANNSQFPGDICGVIYQKNFVYDKLICQFSWYCDRETGVRPINKAMFNESEEVAKKVLLEGFRLPGLKDALYYHGDYINPHWNKQPIAHIGHHIFYK